MLDWSQIEKYYDLGNTAGFAMSMLESEKLLREVLAQKKMPGKNFNDKINLISPYLTSPQSLQHARNLTAQILGLELPRSIAKQTAEQVLRVYFTGITEVYDLTSTQISKLRLNLLGRKVQRLTGKALIYLTLAAVALMAATLFLADTETGRIFTEKLTNISRTAVYKWLPIALGIFTLIVIGISLSIKRKSKSANSAPRAEHNAELKTDPR